uniref:Zinc finger protein 41 n=1 Tax=Cacopsylla melanoneura TaxID=428564 RepID=A0A8D9AF98_9HEMI
MVWCSACCRCIEVWSCCASTCEAAFCSDSGLFSHLVTHAECKPKSPADLCPCCSSLLSTHIQQTWKRVFICGYCDALLTDKSTLLMHIKIVHAGLYLKPTTRWFSCRDCPNKLFRRAEGIIRHMRFWHDKYSVDPKEYAVNSLQDVKYACPVCNKPCYLSTTCSIHRPMKMKLEETDVQLVPNECDEHSDRHNCVECEIKHNDCQSLWSHVFQEHKNAPVKCNICSRQFCASNKYYVLVRHMLKVHNKSLELHPLEKASKNVDCGDKHKKVVEKKYWKDFEKKCQIEVEGVVRFQCPQCPSLLKTFYILKDHLNIHTSEKKYVCELCGTFYLHKSSLKAHMTTHTNVKSKCGQCGKVYSHRNHLNYHITTVHENKWKSAVCPICGRVFLDARNMNKHAAVHSTERPFVCGQCGAAYKWKKHLVRHQKNCKETTMLTD